MRLLKNRQNLLSIAMLGLLLALIAPGTAFADQRGRRRDHDDEKRDRKCAKFENCHDARDGRRDGRGPRRNWDRRDRDGRDWDRRSWDRRDRDERNWDRRDWSRRNDRWDRRRARFHNRHDQRFDAREINRQNTARFRRARG